MTLMIIPAYCFSGNENAYTKMFTCNTCFLGSILPLVQSGTFFVLLRTIKIVPSMKLSHLTFMQRILWASISMGDWLAKTHFHCLCQALTGHLHAHTVYMYIKTLKCRQCLISEKFMVVILNVSSLSQCKMSGPVLYTSVSHS